jgi:hypothetical protein
MRTTTLADRSFVRQQGFEAIDAETVCEFSSALRYQPRLVALIAAAGAITRSPVVFAGLAALLSWAAAAPRLNPFDFAYRRTLGRRSGAAALPPSPMPRRFSAGMGAVFAAAIAVAMASGFRITAWVLQAVLMLAVLSVIYGRLCIGSFLYHLLRGELGFAIGTLPWRRDAGV